MSKSTKISKVGFSLCLIGGVLLIAFWIYQLALEMSYGWGSSDIYLPSLIIGVIVLIGAIIGLKVNNLGYFLSFCSGMFAFAYILILGMVFYGSTFLIMLLIHFTGTYLMYSIGAIISIVGGIIGFFKN